MVLILQNLHQVHSTFPRLQPAFICAGYKIGIGIDILGRLLVFLLNCGLWRPVFFLVVVHLIDYLEPCVIEIPSVELASRCFERQFHFGKGNHRWELFDLADEILSRSWTLAKTDSLRVHLG